MECAMLFNGHTEASIDQIDEEHRLGMTWMYGAGLIGNKGFFDALSPIVSVLWNYFREYGRAPYVQKEFYPQIHEYFFKAHELSQDEKNSQALLRFAYANGADQ